MGRLGACWQPTQGGKLGDKSICVRPCRAIAHTLSINFDTTTQIIKYHGDFDDDASLVLTETDYFDRLTFDSPLDVKFRADALGRTILFIGYSLSDLNIRLLLHRLWQTWHRSGHEKDWPPSFVFMPRRNPIEEAVLAHWGITALSEQDDDPQTALARFLGHLNSLCREMRGQC